MNNCYVTEFLDFVIKAKSPRVKTKCTYFIKGYTLRCALSQIPAYTYKGSWADNFSRFSELHNIKTFGTDYVHQKYRCLECMTLTSIEGMLSYFDFYCCD